MTSTNLEKWNGFVWCMARDLIVSHTHNKCTDINRYIDKTRTAPLLLINCVRYVKQAYNLSPLLNGSNNVQYIQWCICLSMQAKQMAWQLSKNLTWILGQVMVNRNLNWHNINDAHRLTCHRNKLYVIGENSPNLVSFCSCCCCSIVAAVAVHHASLFWFGIAARIVAPLFKFHRLHYSLIYRQINRWFSGMKYERASSYTQAPKDLYHLHVGYSRIPFAFISRRNFGDKHFATSLPWQNQWLDTDICKP